MCRIPKSQSVPKIDRVFNSITYVCHVKKTKQKLFQKCQWNQIVPKVSEEKQNLCHKFNCAKVELGPIPSLFSPSSPLFSFATVHSLFFLSSSSHPLSPLGHPTIGAISGQILGPPESGDLPLPPSLMPCEKIVNIFLYFFWLSGFWPIIKGYYCNRRISLWAHRWRIGLVCRFPLARVQFRFLIGRFHILSTRNLRFP